MKSILVSVGLATLLIATAVSCRPILPIDETRYLSVAWEMFWSGQYSVAHMSGELYSHKPPLLFWLINLVWKMFGVYDLPARSVAPIVGLMCLPVLYWVARGFWPDKPQVAQLAPIVLCACFGWSLFLPMTMFDTLVTLATCLAARGLQLVKQGSVRLGWLTVGLAIGMGLLAKGPVILLFVISGIVVLNYWKPSSNSSESQTEGLRQPAWHNYKYWLGAASAILLGTAIVLAWAIPSALAGGPEYASDLFLGQTAGRVVKSFAHKRPIYWYLPFVPICLLPWIFFRPIWRMRTLWKTDLVVRLLLSWCAVVFTLFSLISGKQLHYLVPLLPLICMVIARAISDSPLLPTRLNVQPIALGIMATALLPWLSEHWSFLSARGLSGLFHQWGSLLFLAIGGLLMAVRSHSLHQQTTFIAVAAIAWSCSIYVTIQPYWQGRDLTPLARKLSQTDLPIAWMGDYQAELNYLGRIKHVTGLESLQAIKQWGEQQTEFYLVYPDEKSPRPSDAIEVGLRPIVASDIDRVKKLVAKLPLDHSKSTLKLTAVYTQNRGLHSQNYFVMQSQPNSTQTNGRE